MEKLGKKLKAHEAEVAKEQELAYDEVSGPESISEFIDRYRNILIGGVGLIVLLVVAGFVYNYFQGAKNLEASATSFNAVYEFEKGNYTQALNGDSLGAFPGFLDVINQYGGTDEGNMAKYYAGLSYLNLGNAAEAVNMLEDVSTGDNGFSVAAKIALASAYEESGDHGAAAKTYESAAHTLTDNKDTSPFALFHAAANYEIMVNNDKALSLYKKIKDDYPASTEAGSIDKYIARVSQ